MIIETTELGQRVERGWNFLTEKLGPDWVDRINSNGLDMQYSGSCILGQLYYGDLNDASEELALDFGEPMINHGFASGSDYTYDELTYAWKELLAHEKRCL